ncbi:MAG TPA: TldD/PmbA family protein, partial [Nitrospiria bacterium]|nr:TldD/PmbA family protein [Nitrospiria bacterium]
MLEGKFNNRAERAIRRARDGSVELILTAKREVLARFGNNEVTQHVDREERDLVIRVIRARRQGRACCNQWDDATLDATVRRATGLAALQPEDPALLPLVGRQAYIPLPRFAPHTAGLKPERKVDAIREAVADCRRRRLTAAGIFSNGWRAVGLANSEGLWAFHEESSASFSVTVVSNDGTGWAERSHWNADRINPSELIKTASEKATMSERPVRLNPGAYTVILEPAAVAELLLFMAWQGFGALPYQEGRSFLSGRLGRHLMDERVTIRDDVWHPDTIGLPFDFEGIPRKRVTLVEKGIARGVVYDRGTAERDGAETTGHALPQPNTSGPLPFNLVMEPGAATIKEMITSTENGILVTRFHYTNLLDPIRLTVTGMTRDGTFLVRNGKLRRPLKNLRFTESVLEAFNRIESIGREAIYTHAFWGGGTVCPALK